MEPLELELDELLDEDEELDELFDEDEVLDEEELLAEELLLDEDVPPALRTRMELSDPSPLLVVIEMVNLPSATSVSNGAGFQRTS